ncbi:tyrosine--tRNA ligase [Candidatus Gottesmanbacteria bacterium CG11_big_fil_rev_8_21_14_0_20_37_11]|uniref:Tyrosine--tRNA ligase n=3 Tax=Candidatus Gottesmaniibacteriota TaxID=1752720 RepID=A0A2M7RPS4_9BACT|nr:MAG: tyrosine--tRNA ligase [Candidatus Gottesmanbacteria bacterium CG1_02_37_22]PIP32260.1 MAG: tyrosine--tRNA ligase [Candidatus Gottesmanbacteria bacterium CG23_combo_of_CG06-09_8_20_14_all_37_19]PIR08360.1 MAG: tyrosine--tRNA ligase [Candidatus Gottesmanbacteria bacterium CG11_big_fil_rev_8_21_14_0_20_37_11]PIZ02326.1 MAG: tyrosine--tRNA ligase [Candidatus Gottesmanbacteria bacterium CG_4_10_14_0_8_um_filter_37_24]
MDKIEELLTRGVDKIYPSKQHLEKILRSGKRLKLYQGFDPTGTQLHIGHMVGLRKLKQFQDLGHHVIFLIGDGTGQAGDPSGKLTARDRFLTREELRNNAIDYVKQAQKIVCFEGKNKAEVMFNGDWLNQLTFIKILDLFGRFSIQQLIERDMFQKRIKEGLPVNLRESIYPILQGYDSVAMGVDLEIGGTDQTFNMLTGRELVKEFLDKEKYVMTLPLLTDSAGRKIGKTEGNVISLTAEPNNLFGMVMNLPDDIIIKCFVLITDISISEIDMYKNEINNGANPMIYKKKLAFTLLKMLYTDKEAKSAQEFFKTTFQEKRLPIDIPSYKIKEGEKIKILDLLYEAKMVKSKSEAKRLILSGALTIDGQKISDPSKQLVSKKGISIKLGKHRFIKLV